MMTIEYSASWDFDIAAILNERGEWDMLHGFFAHAEACFSEAAARAVTPEGRAVLIEKARLAHASSTRGMH